MSSILASLLRAQRVASYARPTYAWNRQLASSFGVLHPDNSDFKT